MEERTIRYVSPTPFAKMTGVISGMLGLIAGLIYGLLFFFVGPYNSGWLGFTTGYSVVILTPIAGLIGGFLGGLLVAAIYNYVSPRIGGVTVQFVAIQGEPKKEQEGFCPKCGHQNRAGSNFCGNCGRPLHDGTVAYGDSDSH